MLQTQYTEHERKTFDFIGSLAYGTIEKYSSKNEIDDTEYQRLKTELNFEQQIFWDWLLLRCYYWDTPSYTRKFVMRLIEDKLVEVSDLVIGSARAHNSVLEQSLKFYPQFKDVTLELEVFSNFLMKQKENLPKN